MTESSWIRAANPPLLKLFAATVLVLGLLWPSASEGGASKKGAQQSQQPSKTTSLKFKNHVYVDRDGIGIEAFRMLIPTDWQFNGGIRWVLDNPGMPAVAGFTVRSPAGTEELEVLPNQPFFWTDNQLILQSLPPGGRYFGNEVRPPLGPLDALDQIVVPRFRRNLEGLKVLGREPLPDLARSLGATTQSQPSAVTSANGGKIRLQYSKAGTPLEEEIYALVESISFSFPSMTGVHTNTNWSVDYIVSFKARQGSLDAYAKTFQTMVSSFRLNPVWFNKYTQVVEQLIRQQIQHIRNIGQLSRIISQTHDEISKTMMDSYNQRQEVYDKISDNFSGYMRGVDEYNDPYAGRPVELPAGYDNAWANPLGEYIVSEDPNFNPNVGSNRTWKRIERRQ